MLVQVGQRLRLSTAWALMLMASSRHWIARPYANVHLRLIYIHIFVCCNQDLRDYGSAGRSETEIEYSVGFDANGIISALECKAWCLAGAFMDLAWNDLYGVMTGLDMVISWKHNNVVLFLHFLDRRNSLLLEPSWT